MDRKKKSGPGGARPGAGRPPLPVGKRTINRTVRMPRDVVRELERIARAEGKGTTVSSLVAKVMTRYVKRRGAR